MTARDIAVQFVQRLELLERLGAIVAELEQGGDGPDVVQHIARDIIELILQELRQ